MTVVVLCSAQTIDTTHLPSDTDTLDEVTVSAFAAQAKKKDVPAAIAVLTQSDLHQGNNGSMLPVFNTIPGVRMEERSPGSYRLSLRGSLLRSPFGVRDVKVYWNDIMLTDAGGNTYLQLVDLNQLQSVEIIKGPASSLYGANTGGAVILRSGDNTHMPGNTLQAVLGGGSYGSFNEQLGWQYSNKGFYSSVQQSHQQADGYRQQTAMRRDAIKWDGSVALSAKEKLSFIGFYTDLYYGTPGGITLQQMQQDPTLARQPGGGFPGAVQQKAAIYNKTAFGGISLASTFAHGWYNTTTLTLNHTGFDNPFILDYEKRNEWNYGGRTTFGWHTVTHNIQWHTLFGAEWQQNQSHINDYGNAGGMPDTVQFMDKAGVTQYFLYAQENIQVGARWLVQLGVSDNRQLYHYRRTTDTSMHADQQKDDGALLAPRFSVLYRINPVVSAYGVIAKGFSPPALAEIIPPDKTYHGDLKPEYGWNYEAGIKGAIWNNRLLFDASVYWFGLQNAIVSRTNTVGQQYFVNAGNTVQNGAEVWLKAYLVHNNKRFVRSLAVLESFSYQPYHFGTYTYPGGDNSGNKLTGVPRTISVTGIELVTKPGLVANVFLNNTSSIPLTDANDAFASAYHLLQAKIGYRHSTRHYRYELYAGGDNLLNEVYSLGNDINAAGKRFYNPSPARNYYIGLWVSL
ncbi:TonB-dependent receptor [Russula earlei]|uniref:TonB-dependent receptor n=1 Tax=Russula earlei TaxID=71964 RepID=A0ACC0U4Y2_9AGAM|nr:TonB-dependent receptor [Russula earlei]